MSNGQTTPMFAPDGSVRDVPNEQVSGALTNGGMRAIEMKDPQGTFRYVRENDMPAALKAGGTLVSAKTSPLPAGSFQQRPGGPVYQPGQEPQMAAARQQAQAPLPQRISASSIGASLEHPLETIMRMGQVRAPRPIGGGEEAALATGAMPGAGMFAAVPSAVTAPGATLASMAGGAIAGPLGEQGAAALGASPENQRRAGILSELIGGATAGGMYGGVKGALTRMVGNKVLLPNGETSLWAEALMHKYKMPLRILKVLMNPQQEAAGMTVAGRFPGATSSATPIGNAPLPEAAGTAPEQLPLTASRFPKTAPPPKPSPFAGMTSSATPIGNEPLPQAGPAPQPAAKLVSEFAKPAAPEPSRVVRPGSTPPVNPVTYQSIKTPDLFPMAQQGDIAAGRELIRRGIELPPNFKFLIEQEAKKIPWRAPETK